VALEEDLKILDTKLMQLKLDYDRYFLGSRPREPVMLRGEVQKQIAVLTNQPIQNTALRFKFGSICSRFQAYKRQWIETLRKIEEGTYSRHRFKAQIHERKPEVEAPSPAAAGARGSDDLYQQYVEARRSCGQDVSNLTPARLETILDKQRATLQDRFGDAKFRFRVVVEDGKARLKASKKKVRGPRSTA
jgi:hypothetical protein